MPLTALVNGSRQRNKLRILCFHGMYQNAAVFAAKTEHLRRDQVEYIYVDAPFTCVPRIINQNRNGITSNDRHHRRVRCTKQEEEFRAWWRPSTGSHHNHSTQLVEDRDILVSFLHKKLSELGEIDGVMGFSQGASLASWMCSAQARVEFQWSPRLAILIGSYVGPHPFCINTGLLGDVTSLHLFGSNDHVISATKSQKVVDLFKEAQCQVVTSIHKQGHVIPKSPEVLANLDAFIADAAVPIQNMSLI